MSRYIDVEKLKDGINKLISEIRDASKRFHGDMGFFEAKLSGIYDVLFLIDTTQKEQKPEWSEEDKKWLSDVYFAIDHSMYSEDERQAMKNYIDSLRKNRKTCDVDEFSLTLRNCLSADSELTKEQADTFARAYGEDLYKVALGEMKSGADIYDIAEYKEDESK